MWVHRISAKRFDRWAVVWWHVEECLESVYDDSGVAMYDSRFLASIGGMLGGRMVAMVWRRSSVVCWVQGIVMSLLR